MARKLRPGQARVEFLVSKNEIFDLIKKGHSSKCVHEILFEQGKITMSYSTLIKFLKKQEKQTDVAHQEPIKAEQKPVAPEATPEKGKQHNAVKAGSEPAFTNIENIPVSHDDIYGIDEKDKKE